MSHKRASFKAASTLDFSEAENVAAIAMEWGANRTLYQKVYTVVGEAYGGFPMFYQMAIESAKALERYARKHKIVWGETADWILTVEKYADAILNYTITKTMWPSTIEQFDAIAKKSITG